MQYYAIINESGKFYDKHLKEWVSVPTLWQMQSYVDERVKKLNKKGVKCKADTAS